MPPARSTPARAPWLPACLALLAACGGDDAGDRSTTEARQGGTAVIGGLGDLQGANPLVANEAWTQEFNRHLLFMPLLRYTPELEYAPWLASSWELEGDSAVVFRLREDIRWHDGVPTTAEDVAFTFRRVLDPATASPNVSLLAGWHGVEVVDSFTVRVRFAPRLEPLVGVPLLAIAPRHLLEDVPPEELLRAPFNKSPVGNGPFRFVSQTANDRWVFEAVEDFPEDLGGRPNLDRVIWRVMPDPTAQTAELRAGRLHVSIGGGIERWVELDSLPGFRGIQRPTGEYLFVGWNGRRPPLDDARVRQALTMAMDRGDMVQLMRRGLAEVSVGPVAPGHWARHPELRPLPFEPDSARALLAEAGIQNRDADPWLERPGGEEMEIELTIPAVDNYRNLAQIIQSDLSDLGVRVGLRTLDPSAYFATFANTPRDFEAALVSLRADLDLNLRDLYHSEAIDGPFQLAGYRNPTVDSLIDAAAAARTRDEARPTLHRIQEILHREQPWSYLYAYPNLFIISERLQDVRMDIRGALVEVGDWWLEAETAGGADTTEAGAGAEGEG